MKFLGQVNASTSGVVNLITSGVPTAALDDGAVAIDTTNNILYIRSGGQWVESSGGASVTVSDAAPSNPEEGDLWFESDTGDVMVYYDSTWVDIGGSSVANIAVQTTAPSTPAAGDLWFDSDTGQLFVWYSDGSSGQWIEVGASSAAANGVDGAVQFASGGTFSSDASNFYWDSTNNRLGVGTASPSELLDINAGTSGSVELTTTGGRTIQLTANDAEPFLSVGSTTSHSAAIMTNGVRRLTVDSSGNVGIGDVSPSYKLDVNGNARFTGSFYLTGIASVPVGEWQSYTPSLSTATLGNGSTTGYYMRVGNIIHAYARFDLGSTSSWDNRFSRISAPVTAKNSGSTSTQDNANIVQVEVNDSSAGLNYIMGGFLYDSGANFRISGWRAIDATANSGIRSGYFLDLSNDVTLADGDAVIVKAIYMADD